MLKMKAIDCFESIESNWIQIEWNVDDNDGN